MCGIGGGGAPFWLFRDNESFARECDEETDRRGFSFVTAGTFRPQWVTVGTGRGPDLPHVPRRSCPAARYGTGGPTPGNSRTVRIIGAWYRRCRLYPLPPERPPPARCRGCPPRKLRFLPLHTGSTARPVPPWPGCSPGRLVGAVVLGLPRGSQHPFKPKPGLPHLDHEHPRPVW